MQNSNYPPELISPLKDVKVLDTKQNENYAFCRNEKTKEIYMINRGTEFKLTKNGVKDIL